jgi:DNA-binding CsgD family transcriptional regulator/tetratricopeptide (TPR) repeat protein
MGQLVGRGVEVSRLRRLLADAAAGQPRALVVHGEAGVGKTRLVRELLAEQDARVLWGTCVHFGASTLPFAPLVFALRAWLPGLEDDLEQGRLIEALDAALERLAAERPTVLVIDDLQWADVSSLDALAYVVASLRGQRLAVVATCRDEHRPDGHPLHGWLADLRRLAGFEEMQLDRLDLAGTEQLVAQVRGRPFDIELVAQVHERSGGNPYLAELLVRDLPDSARQLPDTSPVILTQALTARWHALSGPGRTTAQVLAVGGRPQPRSLLVRVAGAHGLSEQQVDDAVAEAIEQGVVTASENRLWFRHPLLADVLYAAVPPGVAARVHGTYATVLEGLTEVAERRRAGDLAVHHLHADRLAEAYLWSLRAADAARAAAASSSEAAHLERACALWPDVPDAARGTTRDRVELLRRAAHVHGLIGRCDVAVPLLEKARSLVSEHDDPELASTLLSSWCDLVWQRDAPVRAVRPELEEALRMVDHLADSPVRVHALAALAGAHAWDSHRETAARYADDAVEVARRSGSDEALAEALICRSRVQTDDVAGRLADVVEGYDLARRIGAGDLMTDAAIWQVNLFERLGRPRDAARLARDAAEEGLVLGSQTWAYFLMGMAACSFLQLGEWEEAHRLARRALAARQHGIPGALARLAAAQHAVLVGRAAEARLHLERALELVPLHFAGLHFDMTRTQLQLLLAEGDPEGALEWVLGRRRHPTVLEFGADVAHRAWTAWAAADVAERARDRGDAATVDRMGELVATLARTHLSTDTYAVATSEGRRLMRFAEAEEARCRRTADEEARWAVAAAAAQEAGTPWCEAYALWRQVQAGARAGTPRVRLAEPLRQAHGLAARLGAVPLREQVEFLATSARISLADVDVPVQRTRAQSADGGLVTLTPREQEVLSLLVAGRTNGEVARRLGISEKTAGSHVSSILRKTGTSSRLEAAELARRAYA